jgi:hypothetical protein
MSAQYTGLLAAMLAISNPEPKTSFSRSAAETKDERVALLNFHLHIAGSCLNECG